MTKLKDLKQRFMENPEFREEYAQADEEYALVEELVRARTAAKLTQAQVAERLSGSARAAIADESNDIVVSAASAWEIATRFRIGKLPGCEAVAVDVAGHIAGQGFKELAIEVADAERAGRLSGSHRDPFDRMLAAQALARELPIVSVDPVFDGFGIVRLW